MSPFTAHREYLAAFVDALFRYADEGTYVSWRAFRDDTKDAPPVFIAATSITADRNTLVDTAVAAATDAASRDVKAVFCPPIATFTSSTRAREVDLANGLALSVECDSSPAAARDTLEAILGPATVVVASGGTTTAGEPKLHLHWRLAEPTSDSDEHARLKRARILATAIAGGDATNVPAVHPIRWPGSWHRKHEPRLATIVSIDPDREITLGEALDQLELVAPSVARPIVGTIAVGEVASLSALVAQLMSGEAMHQPLVTLAYRYLKMGMADAHCVLTLRGLMDSIPIVARGSDERWGGHYRDIPRTVRTAREKVDLEAPAATADISGFMKEVEAPPKPPKLRLFKPEVRDMPQHLLEPPGVLGTVAKYGVESAARPVPIFAVQAALALGSVVCGRRYVTSQNNYSSLYFLNVAKSGSGKEEAKRTIERVLGAAGAKRLIGGSSFSSGNAVFSALLKKPQHITVIDEFGKYLEAANGGRDTFKADALTQIIEAFGRCDGDMITPQFSTMTLSAAAATNHEPKTIVRPAMTLMAMATPSTFYDAMTSVRVQDGFLNRFLVAEHNAARRPMESRTFVPVPPQAVEWVKQLLAPHGDLDLGGQTDTIGDARVVEFSESASALARAFDVEMVAWANDLDAHHLGDMPIRAAEIAMRLSLIIAMSDTPDTPMVTSDCFEWARDYVRYFLEQTIAAVRDRVADSHTERTSQIILRAIRMAGPGGLRERMMMRGKIKGIPKRERVDALETLEAAELIKCVEVKTGGPGRPKKVWIALDEDEAGATDDSDVECQKPEIA